MDFANLSIAELKAQEKKTLIIIWIFAVCIIILISTIVIRIFLDGFKTTSVIPIFCIPLLALSIKKLKK